MGQAQAGDGFGHGARAGAPPCAEPAGGASRPQAGQHPRRLRAGHRPCALRQGARGDAGAGQVSMPYTVLPSAHQPWDRGCGVHLQPRHRRHSSNAFTSS